MTGGGKIRLKRHYTVEAKKKTIKPPLVPKVLLLEIFFLGLNPRGICDLMQGGRSHTTTFFE